MPTSGTCVARVLAMNPRCLAPVLLMMLALAAPAAARVNDKNTRGAPAPTAEGRTSPRATVLPQRTPHGSRADEKRYSARENASKNAQKFRGGEPVIVITATVAIIVLLGILIILLVT